jgi:hypothetical protein
MAASWISRAHCGHAFTCCPFLSAWEGLSLQDRASRIRWLVGSPPDYSALVDVKMSQTAASFIDGISRDHKTRYLSNVVSLRGDVVEIIPELDGLVGA